MPSHNHVVTNGATQVALGTSGYWCLAGESTGTTPTGYTGYTGGSSAHSHSISERSHSHNFSGPPHDHTVTTPSHTHGVGSYATPVLTHTATSTVGSASNLPPYVAVHFIMYIGE